MLFFAQCSLKAKCYKYQFLHCEPRPGFGTQNLPSKPDPLPLVFLVLQHYQQPKC